MGFAHLHSHRAKHVWSRCNELHCIGFVDCAIQNVRDHFAVVCGRTLLTLEITNPIVMLYHVHVQDHVLLARPCPCPCPVQALVLVPVLVCARVCDLLCQQVASVFGRHTASRGLSPLGHAPNDAQFISGLRIPWIIPKMERPPRPAPKECFDAIPRLGGMPASMKGTQWNFRHSP